MSGLLDIFLGFSELLRFLCKECLVSGFLIGEFLLPCFLAKPSGVSLFLLLGFVSCLLCGDSGQLC